MTATSVNGVKVVANESVETPLSRKNPSGSPVYYRRVVKLVLEDGGEIYGCTECERVSDRVMSISSHLPTHTRAGRPRQQKIKVEDDEGELVVDLLEILGQFEGLQSELERLRVEVGQLRNELRRERKRRSDAARARDQYRERAVLAEKKVVRNHDLAAALRAFKVGEV